MNKKEAKLLMDTVNNVFKTSPILLIGEECVLTFSKAWEGKIIEIDKDNIKDIVEYYSILTLSYPLVLEDISNLNTTQVNYLLKLIEESKNPIILLASYDNINSILLSRIKTVIKFKKIERSLPDAEPVRAGRKKYEGRIHQSCCMFTESCACRPESQRRCYNCRAAPRRGTRGSACRISRACNDGLHLRRPFHARIAFGQR